MAIQGGLMRPLHNGEIVVISLIKTLRFLVQIWPVDQFIEERRIERPIQMEQILWAI